MPRIAFTAKPATSRTRFKTSTGWSRKAAEAPITPICRFLAASSAVVALVASDAALASRQSLPQDPARTYVEARAAALSGDHGRSAELLAYLVERNAASPTIARKALIEAISAGNTQLALRLIRRIPQESLPIEATLLLAAEDLRVRKADRAISRFLGSTDERELSFIVPFLRAWTAAERGDASRALTTIATVSSNNALSGGSDEHSALIMLKLRRPAEAEPYARRAVGTGGPREQRLRLAFADGFLAAGDRARAEAMIEGMGMQAASARRSILQGRPSGLAIDTSAKAYSELLLRLAVDLTRLNNRGLAIAFAQIARHSAQGNDAGALLLAALLESNRRSDDALAVLRSVGPLSPLASQARDLEVRTLVASERTEQALAIATAAASGRNADSSDFARLGDALNSMKRYSESADAYQRALQLAEDQAAEHRWPLLLLRANSLEQANRWPEARAALEAALSLSPDQPLILNFLGYAKLERGEDLDLAEAMIRKASQLAPDDASITDSLGWALYKRGRIDEAIEVLQRAARGDPDHAEIQEHLGDALYKAGRKFEARFAWQAALTSAEDEIAERVRAKIEFGLTQETAAP